MSSVPLPHNFVWPYIFTFEMKNNAIFEPFREVPIKFSTLRRESGKKHSRFHCLTHFQDSLVSTV